MVVQAVTLLLAVLSLSAFWAASRRGSPTLGVLARWLRWFFAAFLIAGIVHTFRLTGYPLSVLLVVALLGWFLLETAYNWLALSALSKSDLPLFPKFEENERGDEWPSEHRFIELKNWLRRTGLKKRQSLVTYLGEQVLMRVIAYENPAEDIRLHILFLPNPRGSPMVCLSCFSATQAGDYLVTDNLFLPFGGFYPENWNLERRPWMRDPSRLWQRHLARIDARAETLAPFVLSPLEQINEDQRRVEQLNRDLKFLNPVVEQAEKGRLSMAGKARVWQEIWTLSYLGIPLRYT